MVGATSLLETVSLATLRERRSEKWLAYPPDVLPAFVAEMDFALAVPIRDALSEAVRIGDTGYAHVGDLFDALAAFAKDWFAWDVDFARMRLVPDVMIGVAEVLSVLTKPGDRIVINTPAYPPFWQVLHEYRREIDEVPMRQREAAWDIDLDAIEAAFAGGARAYLLCNPHNPTGRVFSREELTTIAGLAHRYGVAIVADEIHGLLVLPGSRHVPFVSLGDELAGHAVTVTSASKAWNIAGLKCALAVAGSNEMLTHFAHLPKELTARAGNLGVIASVAAFRHGAPWLRDLVAYLDGNRRHLAELLVARLPKIRFIAPQASYLAWLDCRELGLGDDPAKVFLKRGQVALSRGLDFGPPGAGFARLNIGTSRELMREAVDRMSAAVGG